MNKYLKIEKIKYEGPESIKDFAFKYYNPNRIVHGKKMKEWLRFSLAYWHTFESQGQDPFGEATRNFEWDSLEPMERAREKVIFAFEYFEIMGVEYFTFHDKDIAPEVDDIKQYFNNIDEIVELIKTKMEKTNIKLLWNTSNLFSHKRYASGAGTSPVLDVFCYAAAQTKHSLDIAKKLRAKNFVFWGGREGYSTLLSTNTSQEEKQMASLFKLAIKYADKIGFKGQFLIEPKAKEPMVHQYDYDASTVLSFLRKFDLTHKIKLNLEQNHALLAGHSFQHELRVARENGVLGSIDSNEGNPLLGWDTDQFPHDIYESTYAMYELLLNNGIAPGGLNFDSKLRRSSNSMKDLVHGAILGMDVYAKGLLAASKIIKDREIENFVNKRYLSWNSDLGRKILNNEEDLENIANIGIIKNIQKIPSSKQEFLEWIIMQKILESK